MLKNIFDIALIEVYSATHTDILYAYAHGLEENTFIKLIS